MQKMEERLQEMEGKIGGNKVLTCIVLAFLVYFATNYQSLDEMEAYSRQLQQLQAKSLSLQKEVAHLEQGTNSMRDELDSLRQYAVSEQKEVAHLKQTINSMRDELDSLRQYAVSEQKEVAHRKQAINSMRGELDSLRKYSDKLANEIIDIHAN